ncbi:MAG TPA: adenine deaminase C-terminal domain-containing protein [Bacillota bacterium]|nr:adenine deaminase C-terminal domain-containing protein [Bacillota bacterium]
MKLQATRRELIEVSRGLRPANIYIKGGTMVNVFSGELLSQNIAIYKDAIAYVGNSEDSIGPETQIISAEGRYITPGFIEVHAHPWIVYNPVSVTGRLLSQGTTTTVNDNLFFYLYMGASGFNSLTKDLGQLPGTLLWSARIVSQSEYPDERDWFNQEDIKSVLANDAVVGIAEITRWPLAYNADSYVLDTVEYAKSLGKVACGHNAGCSADKLNTIAASGITSCHEAITPQEALDRLRLGLWTILRNSSLRPDFPEVLKIITEGKVNTSRLMLTTDGPHPSFFEEEGSADGLVRRAVEQGVSAVQAIQMVTINPATYLGLDDYLGAIAPGRQADLLLLPDLEGFNPEKVIARGEIVAEQGHFTGVLPQLDWENYIIKKPFSILRSLLENPQLYQYPLNSTSQSVPVASYHSAVINKREDIILPEENGFANLSGDKDLVQATLINRDGKWISRMLVKNFASGVDGMASTFNTTAELLVMGRNPTSMALAAARVHDMNGGIVIVDGEQVVLEIPLDLTGMMTSSASFDQAVEYQNLLLAAMQSRGYPFHDILYSLLFLTCDFLPGLRLTALGLYEVKTHKIIVPAEPLNCIS